MEEAAKKSSAFRMWGYSLRVPKRNAEYAQVSPESKEGKKILPFQYEMLKDNKGIPYSFLNGTLGKETVEVYK
jgi:hypothetical protein